MTEAAVQRLLSVNWRLTVTFFVIRVSQPASGCQIATALEGLGEGFR